jgi:hypothetical protein
MITMRYATRRVHDLYDVVERVDQILPAIIAAAPSRVTTDTDRL